MARFPKLLLLFKEQESRMINDAKSMLNEKVKNTLAKQEDRFKKYHAKEMGKKGLPVAKKRVRKRKRNIEPPDFAEVEDNLINTPPRSNYSTPAKTPSSAGSSTAVFTKKAYTHGMSDSALRQLASTLSTERKKARLSSPQPITPSPPKKIVNKRDRALLATQLFTQKMTGQPKHKKKGSRPFKAK